MNFIGRTRELSNLKRFFKKNTASFLVVRGRRRIGKSRLIEEFAKQHKFYQFIGVAPTKKTSAQSQRNEFASQLGKQGLPAITATDWNDLFWLLAERVQKERTVILLDEISWMGSKDPNFLGKLKNVWDQYFKKNNKLILVLCGSASSWIEQNILSNTGFVGRISYTLTLGELPLPDCSHFWGKNTTNISAMEKLKILAITGGIPRYLEEIDPSLDPENNIQKLCFSKGALLVNEFEHMFSNIFLSNSETYKNILYILANGDKELSQISASLNAAPSGRTSEYLSELELSGFITRNYTWDLQSGRDGKLSKYRLSDNYIRFYLKYIEPYKTQIERNSFEFSSLGALPGWNIIIALQFENLVLNNKHFLWQLLNINPAEILTENPFFQRKTSRQNGCQIDYLVQTKFGSLYVCEIKFSKHKINYNIISQMTEKIANLNKPKHLSCRPVLIHVNGVDLSVIESGYFSNIIDFSAAFN